MARIITKELAFKIAEKLKAQKSPRRNRAHDDYFVFYQDNLITKFSIRRGSEKDKGHDFLCRLIYLGPHDARLFGQCQMSYEDWIQRLRDLGIIPRKTDQK